VSIKAIAFDIDGTLYPNSIMYLRSLWFAIRHYPLIRSVKAVRDEMRKTPQPGCDFRTIQAQKVADRLNISPEHASHRLNRYVYGDWEMSLRGIALYPGVIEFIAWCRAQGLKMGLASDFPVERKLQVLNITVPWDCMVSTEATGCLKPHALPFKTLADGLGCPPEQILYVGNSYAYDILGAKAVGMLAAHLAGRPVLNSRADYTFSSYAQLQQWITNQGLIESTIPPMA
jgi:putative hydrolase of the HAD superfamily